MPEPRISGSPFLAGASVGLFIGMLLGLSGSPVVATFLGVVSSIGAVVLAGKSVKETTPSGKSGTDHPSSPFVGSFLAGFGLVATVALLSGVYLRSHQSLGPKPLEQRDRWIQLGVSPEEARQLVIHQLTSTGGPEHQKTIPDGLAPYLFSTKDLATALELDPEGRSLEKVRAQWRDAGVLWSNLVTQADHWTNLNTGQKSTVLTHVWKAVMKTQ